MKSNGLYVHYGCGICAPKDWVNFDAAPGLLLTKIPLLSSYVSWSLKKRKKLNSLFPENVRYGNIVKGLPGMGENSCAGVFCSHVLEHLSLEDFRTALKNTYRILKKDGIFRLVVPDLEYCAKMYETERQQNDSSAAIKFMNRSGLGIEKIPKTIGSKITRSLGFPYHLWMWDFASLSDELKETCFIKIRKASFNDSADKMFLQVEEKNRFEDCLAIECSK